MRFLKSAFHQLGSLGLTVVLLAASMVLVFLATLDQTSWGIRVVQTEYFESFICAYPINADAGFRMPLPGGFLIGTLLTLNLIAAHFRYFKPGFNRIGIAITHAGVLLLIISGFTTAALQKEAMTIIPQGRSSNFASDFYECEIALTDRSQPNADTVTVIPDAVLRDASQPVHKIPGSKLELRMQRFYPNAPVIPPMMLDQFPGLTPVKVDNGVGASTNIVIIPQRENFSPNARNSPSAVVELLDDGKSRGTWLLNIDLADTAAPQTFVTADGREYLIELRMKRTYFPFSLHLDKFTHDKYPGTEIPKNFASDVTILDPREAGPRAATISMNQPLRHDGYTFYQASYNVADGETSTALQTVQNASYLLPYLAITLVGIGMCIQFGISLTRFLRTLGKTA